MVASLIPTPDVQADLGAFCDSQTSMQSLFPAAAVSVEVLPEDRGPGSWEECHALFASQGHAVVIALDI